ncbi:MAG: phage tail protein [Candidatus Delongbacteria bacterium]|nr:phage tail protein [Candidatus Delongbacteria bacterium]
MADPFIGEIRLWGCNFAPYGWAFCDGSLLSVNQNQALFNLIGNSYGGDGNQTFAVPNLKDRIPIGFGQGPGLTNHPIASSGGQTAHTLTANEMPSHSHSFTAGSATCSLGTPQNNYFGIPRYSTTTGTTKNALNYASAADSPGMMNPNVIAPIGGSQSHENRQPYLTLNFCIALEGEYPVRP